MCVYVCVRKRNQVRFSWAKWLLAGEPVADRWCLCEKLVACRVSHQENAHANTDRPTAWTQTHRYSVRHTWSGKQTHKSSKTGPNRLFDTIFMRNGEKCCWLGYAFHLLAFQKGCFHLNCAYLCVKYSTMHYKWLKFWGHFLKYCVFSIRSWFYWHTFFFCKNSYFTVC